MTPAKRKLVEDYVKSLSDAIDTYYGSDPNFMVEAENVLFRTILEIRAAFSKDLPNIGGAISIRKGTGILDANSVLGILKLYLADDDETHSTQKQPSVGIDIAQKIFFSHRSIDKKFADIFENFLTTCGVSYNNIFCSSLPGNDIIEKISLEVKENLSASVLNIVILSADFYHSAYCHNEAGIIWFLDTEKIVIALPEIDENLMQGFLNNEHKIRRLNSKSDISAICDIVKRFFADFITSAAKLDANIDRLIEQYNEVIKTRTVAPAIVPHDNNELERRIFANEFSDEELMIFYYFYETQTYSVGDDLIDINQWLCKKKITLPVKNGFNVLADDGIIEYRYVNEEFQTRLIYKMVIGSYRELRRLSKKAISIFEQNCLKHAEAKSPVMSDNPIDNLIMKGFTHAEILLIKYILDLQRENLFAGWQSGQEVMKIQNWEEINTLNDCLSRNYEDTILKLEIRKFIDPCAKTANGNTKEYRIRDTFLKSLSTLGQAALDQIQLIIQENKEELDLPF